MRGRYTFHTRYGLYSVRCTLETARMLVNRGAIHGGCWETCDGFLGGCVVYL